MANNYQYIPPLSNPYPVPPVFLPPNAIPAIPVPSIVPPLAEQPAWVEYVSQDGRPYYNNRNTGMSTWEKPDELKTYAERILSDCQWKEFPSDTGKPYYYNSVTNKSVWFKPPELIEAEKLAYGTTDIKVEETPMPNIKKEEKETNAIDEAIKATLGSYPIPQPSKKSSNKDSSSDDEGEIKTNAIPVPNCPSFQTKEQMEEGWRQLLRDLNISGNTSWESAVKIISTDPRYNELKKYNQKKQIFNTYKTQRQKEEREEGRLKIKKAKEDLEGFLYNHPKLSSNIVYRKADSLLSSCTEWTIVPERDRREIYEDVVIQMAKREKEKARVRRKRNIKLFDQILNEMPNLTFKTTWYEAQRILLENPRFVEDEELQSMDKEDALICFEEHIKVLEKDRDEEKEREKRRMKRQQRKNREAFNVFLDELHEKKKLTSLSMWKDLYPIISRDERFYKMLSQPGSTSLDLFKFYVLGLKSKYSKEKKVAKEILEMQNFTVEINTNLETFLKMLENDDRGKLLDAGNIRMAFNSFIGKAEAAEKQRKKEASRLQKKLECNFLQLLKVNDITTSMSWEDVCHKLSDHQDFQAVNLESDRMKYYKEHLLSVRSRSRSKRRTPETKKKRKHRSSSRETSSSKPRKSKKKKRNDSSVESKGRYDSCDEDEPRNRSKAAHKKSKKKKRKKRRHRQNSWSSEEIVAEKTVTRQPSEGEVIDDDDIEPPTKEKKKKRSLSSGEMSENELEAEKSLLLAQLRN